MSIEEMVRAETQNNKNVDFSPFVSVSKIRLEPVVLARDSRRMPPALLSNSFEEASDLDDGNHFSLCSASSSFRSTLALES